MSIGARTKVSRYLECVAVLYIIVCSGSWLGITYARFLDTAFVIGAVLFAVYRGYLRRQPVNYVVLALFVSLYMINYVINIPYAPGTGGYIAYGFRLVGTYFICSSITHEAFEKHFIDWITLLSATGLVAFYFVVETGILDSLPLVGGNPVLGPFNMARRYINSYDDIPRNPNIFWEPGAYQLFISLAMIMILRRDGWLPRLRNLFPLGVLILSMFTTNSTSGYFSLLVIFAFAVFANWRKIKSMKVKLLLATPAVIAMAVACFVILRSDTVTNKLTMDNESFSIRMNDFIKSWEIVIEEFPIFGLGLETNRLYEIYAAHNIENNSVGFLTTAIAMGIIFIACYTAQMCASIFRRYRWDFPVVAVVVLIACATELFYHYAIFYVLLFRMRGEAVVHGFLSYDALTEREVDIE